MLETVAGDGRRGYGGDGGAAAAARLAFPAAVALDADGNLFVADEMNHRVRRVDPAGVITTVAGDGSRGEAGDGGAATSAQLSFPCSVAVDASGVLYVADAGNRRVRRVDGQGVITTVVAEPEPFLPTGVAVDADGVLHVADVAGRRVLRLDAQGALSTVTGPAGLEAPYGLAVDSGGTVHIADRNAHRVYRWTDDGPEPVAGCGVPGDEGDGGPATAAGLSYPCALAVDAQGGLLIADNLNHRVRRLREAPVPTARAALEGAADDLTRLLPRPFPAPPSEAALPEDPEDLPPLEAGFYLYQDVVLGALVILGPLLAAHAPPPERPGAE
ncbi:NHL domain-containing protein [Kitasatospora aureofaciens]|uniref:NHL domain-containing protein n=1 Tax=Kitasatospora aureofaciens TaxID=1894 RepID=UPI0037CC4C6B